MSIFSELVVHKCRSVSNALGLLFVVTVILWSGNLNAAASGLPDWSYSGENGPSSWAGLTVDGVHFPYATCGAGQQQSPINLEAAVAGNIDELEIDYQSWPLNIENNGHTIQVNVAPGSTIEIDDEIYYLLQFHFHAGSEHVIGGQQAPLEIHFVHMNKHGKLAVLGIMVKEGHDDTANETLSVVLEKAPYEVAKHALSGDAIRADNLLPGTEIESLWYYSGSLTTPPCTEGVKWFVAKKHLHASHAQLEEFENRLHHNYRPIQLLNDRTLYENK